MKCCECLSQNGQAQTIRANPILPRSSAQGRRRLGSCTGTLPRRDPTEVLLTDGHRDDCDDRCENTGRAGSDGRLCRWEAGASPKPIQKTCKTNPPARKLEWRNNLTAMDLR